MTVPNIDLGLIGLAGVTLPTLLAQVPGIESSPLSMGEYGIVGLTVVLALWALREQSQRRIDDAKAYAEDLKQVFATSLQESKQNADTQRELLLRLLERGKDTH